MAFDVLSIKPTDPSPERNPQKFRRRVADSLVHRSVGKWRQVGCGRCGQHSREFTACRNSRSGPSGPQNGNPAIGRSHHDRRAPFRKRPPRRGSGVARDEPGRRLLPPPENISEHPAGNDRRETRPRPEKRKGDPIRSRLHRANQRAYRWATNMTTETVVPANSFSKGPCQAQFQPFSAPLFFAETGRIATNFPPSATKRAAASR